MDLGVKFWRLMSDFVDKRIHENMPNYGKYRGIIRDNKDPLKLGRIRAEVPGIYGLSANENQWSPWALPCVPYAGKTKGMYFTPRVGDLVWIEFEEGEISKPIWAGMLFGTDDMSPQMTDDAPLDNVIETAQYRVELRDTNSSADSLFPLFKIESKLTGTKIEIDETEEAQKLTVSQASGNAVVMDSTSGSENVTVTEATNGNTITMDASGTAINATGDIDIDGSANVTIDGATNVEATAGTTVTIDGGGSTLEVAAAGTTVSGGVITIGAAPMPATGFCSLPACVFSGAPHTTNVHPG
tara:strand:- start:803 stop:1699 length:897 start_codon:yes stop_codon:yes gene_type:complete